MYMVDDNPAFIENPGTGIYTKEINFVGKNDDDSWWAKIEVHDMDPDEAEKIAIALVAVLNR